MRFCRVAGVLLIVVVLAVGCSGPAARDRSASDVGTPSQEPRVTTSALPTSAAPTETRASTPPAPPHPVSIQALIAKEYTGGHLQVADVLEKSSRYTRHAVTYRSGDLRISGVMNVPTGNGPFPALVLNHGYIDPDIYTTGRGLRREQDYLARRGFVVLHTDYRNHAQSDDDPDAERNLRLGYTEDVINAVLALRTSRLPYVDPERIGLLGRSMGGGVTFNVLVTAPGLVDAAVVYAPVSSNAVENFDRWIRGQPENQSLAEEIIAAYGSPEANPTFWRNVSPATFFDRVTEPILVHHGTADQSCPIAWSERTVALLTRLRKDVQFLTYPGEPHAFEAAWETSMKRTVEFLEQHLR